VLHGPQKDQIDLSFAVPSLCADRVAAGQADIGLVPVYEIDRLSLGYYPTLGIGARGPVRSILLISKSDPRRIRRLAADSGSRTSVQLARIVLAERYGASPEIISADPNLDRMLEIADAALLIGDSALRVDPVECGLPCLDLAEEWIGLTGLPMIFALWAGRPAAVTPSTGDTLLASAQFGLSCLDEIVSAEAATRALSPLLVEQYLTRHIQFLLGPEDEEGMRTYLRMAQALNTTTVQSGDVRFD
jgi:predicted solute-binding protein